MGKEKCKEREIAIFLHQAEYFTGNPCRYGHIGNRKVTSSECITCYDIRKINNLKTSMVQQARNEGKDKYNTGKLCKHGHMSDRWTSNSTCVECCSTIHYGSDRERYRTGNTLEKQLGARKVDALKNNIPFNICIDNIMQPEYCPVFGIKLNYGWSGEGRKSTEKASIDRLIPELGYVKGNVFVISLRANRLKNNMTIEELESILKYMKEVRI